MTWFEIGVLLLLFLILLRQPSSPPSLAMFESRLEEIEDLLRSIQSTLCDISQNTEKADDHDFNLDDHP